jgi:hypothetical protein
MLKKVAEEETTFKGKVRVMLAKLKEDKYKGNYKVSKHIEKLEPLFDTHDFWDSQPVPKPYEPIDESLFDKPIDSAKTVSDVKPEPYSLPEGFYWANLDISDRNQVEEVYTLLT